jgi:hypothetical protein
MMLSKILDYRSGRYNARVSLGTFLFVAAAAAFLWGRDRGIDRALALMLLTIALIQLLEWGLWTNLSCGVSGP